MSIPTDAELSAAYDQGRADMGKTVTELVQALRDLMTAELHYAADRPKLERARALLTRLEEQS